MHGPTWSEPCANATLCDPDYFTSDAGKCGWLHRSAGPDPQFLGSSSFSGYTTQLNHEIDIEIPAGCHATPNVCNGSDGSCAGLYKCGPRCPTRPPSPSPPLSAAPPTSTTTCTPTMVARAPRTPTCVSASPTRPRARPSTSATATTTPTSSTGTRATERGSPAASTSSLTASTSCGARRCPARELLSPPPSSSDALGHEQRFRADTGVEIQRRVLGRYVERAPGQLARRRGGRRQELRGRASAHLARQDRAAQRGQRRALHAHLRPARRLPAPPRVLRAARDRCRRAAG